MFLLVSVHHVSANTHGHQHSISIQISKNFVKTFLRISCIRNIPLTWILARVLDIYLLSLSRFWTVSIEQFWFLFWSILNGVTPKTSNSRVNCLKTIPFTAAHTFIARIWQYIQPPPPLPLVLTTHLSVCSTFIIRSIACVPTSRRNFWMQHKKMLRK